MEEESGTSDQNDIDHILINADPHAIYKQDFFPKSIQPAWPYLQNNSLPNNFQNSEQVDSIKKRFWMTIMEVSGKIEHLEKCLEWFQAEC